MPSEEMEPKIEAAAEGSAQKRQRSASAPAAAEAPEARGGQIDMTGFRLDDWNKGPAASSAAEGGEGVTEERPRVCFRHNNAQWRVSSRPRVTSSPRTVKEVRSISQMKEAIDEEWARYVTKNEPVVNSCKHFGLNSPAAQGNPVKWLKNQRKTSFL